MKKILFASLVLLSSQLSAQPLPAAKDSILPNTTYLNNQGLLSDKIMTAAHKFLDKKLQDAPLARHQYWKYDFSNKAAFTASISANKERFMKILGIEPIDNTFPNYHIGIADKNPEIKLEKNTPFGQTEIIAETPVYQIFNVRWTVLRGVNSEGIMLQPKGEIKAYVIAIPDADQTPEQLAGLTKGIDPSSQYVRTLAENGVMVIIPALINRTYIFENEDNQLSHREWIYRQAYHMGRHITGYEVQKIMTAVTWLQSIKKPNQSIGVAGYNEGGLLAFYAAAADTRIDCVLVSGYFQNRDKSLEEPLYRNTFGLLKEFGDAEIAAMIAPRPLIIEHSELPYYKDIIAKYSYKAGSYAGFTFDGYKGEIKTPEFEAVHSEFERVQKLVPDSFQKKYLVTNGKKAVQFGSKPAIDLFLKHLNISSGKVNTHELRKYRTDFDEKNREERLLKEIENHVQHLIDIAPYVINDNFLYKLAPDIKSREWSTKLYHPISNPNNFIDGAKAFKETFKRDIIGYFDDKKTPLKVMSRKVYDKELYTGFEVYFDVFDDFGAGGFLLLPKDLKQQEKRPIIVVQHGRNGTGTTAIEIASSYYGIAAKLVEQGFIVFTPHGIFRGENQYRNLGRKGNRIGKTMFSLMVAQNEQIVSWLKTLDYVDPQRIAYYGKSFGGEAAMRIPAIIDDYCLSICSGDYGDWTRKVTDTYLPRSFMNSFEWDMPYFNMGMTFNYADMSYLIFPRPFMVERGSDDLVQPDEWVASEYAKTHYLYQHFGLKDKTAIQFFNGGHASHNTAVFDFLHKHLRW